MNTPVAAGSPATVMSLAEAPNRILDVFRSVPVSVLTVMTLKFENVKVQGSLLSVIVGVEPMMAPTSAAVMYGHGAAFGLVVGRRPDGMSNGGSDGMLIGGM